MNDYIKRLNQEFTNVPDLIIKNIKLGPLNKCQVVFLETLCSQNKINDYILKKLTNKNVHNILSDIPGGNIKTLKKYDECEYYLYSGYTLIFLNQKIYAVETKADINRSVSTNEIEPALKGPKNAFVENYQINMGLIKKRIKSHNLKTKVLNLGRYSNSAVGILYLDGVVKESLVQNVYDKLKNIDIDIINDAEDLISYLSEKKLFPTVIATERPDRCADALTEGKVVIICDESPNALIVPGFLIDYINPYADKYVKGKTINFTKIIRLLCFFLSAVVPAFYIAIINYNQEAIPTNLVVNFAIQRDGVPFPAIIECIILLVICEILRESDLRFPNKYGSAISILGALVLGDAAVNAGLVSPIMIIITAFTYISSLLFNDIEISNALRIYRFFFLFAAALLGLYGLLAALIIFIINLCDTKSLDMPYTFPIAPYDKPYFKKTFFKSKNTQRSQLLSENKTKEQI